MPVTIIASGGDNGYHLAADIKEVYWGSAAFGVLLLFALWKGGPLLVKAMKGRTEKIRAEISEAETKRSEAEEALQLGASSLPDIGQERSRIRREAIETAEQVKRDLLESAAEEAKAIRARGHVDIDNMKQQASADLESQVTELTRQATEVIVKKDLSESSQADLIDSYIQGVGQLA